MHLCLRDAGGDLEMGWTILWEFLDRPLDNIIIK